MALSIVVVERYETLQRNNMMGNRREYNLEMEIQYVCLYYIIQHHVSY